MLENVSAVSLCTPEISAIQKLFLLLIIISFVLFKKMSLCQSLAEDLYFSPTVTLFVAVTNETFTPLPVMN